MGGNNTTFVVLIPRLKIRNAHSNLKPTKKRLPGNGRMGPNLGTARLLGASGTLGTKSKRPMSHWSLQHKTLYNTSHQRPLQHARRYFSRNPRFCPQRTVLALARWSEEATTCSPIRLGPRKRHGEVVGRCMGRRSGHLREVGQGSGQPAQRRSPTA